jgi:hypothetical protein
MRKLFRLFFKVNSVQKLNNKANKALGIFEKAKQDLNKVVLQTKARIEEVEAERTRAKEEFLSKDATLKGEAEQLLDISRKNLETLANIASIVG